MLWKQKTYMYMYQTCQSLVFFFISILNKKQEKHFPSYFGHYHRLTFFRVWHRKRERPTRCWTADIRIFRPFSSIAPAEPITGRRDWIFFWFFANRDGIAIVLRTLYRVGASFFHSFSSLDHLNFFRSFTDVHFNTDFLFLSSFLHSLSTSKQERLTRALRSFLHLNAAKLIAELDLALQRAIPRLHKFTGNSLEMVLDWKWTITWM